MSSNASVNKSVDPRFKTVACGFIIKGRPCTKGDKCPFAHSARELRPFQCRYDDERDGCYGNVSTLDGNKVCNFVHKGETPSSYIQRTKQMWPVDVTPFLPKAGKEMSVSEKSEKIRELLSIPPAAPAPKVIDPPKPQWSAILKKKDDAKETVKVVSKSTPSGSSPSKSTRSWADQAEDESDDDEEFSPEPLTSKSLPKETQPLEKKEVISVDKTPRVSVTVNQQQLLELTGTSLTFDNTMSLSLSADEFIKKVDTILGWNVTFKSL